MDDRRTLSSDSSLVDEQRLDEIALLTRLMIAATSRTGPLSQAEIDQFFEQSPLDLPRQSRSASGNVGRPKEMGPSD